LSGLADLTELDQLGVILARRLHDISDVAGLAPLRELTFEDCPGIAVLDDVEQLVSLRVLSFRDCGDVESLGPLRGLDRLGEFYAWGSTRIVDEDLSPLPRLPRLKEIRNNNRAGHGQCAKVRPGTSPAHGRPPHTEHAQRTGSSSGPRLPLHSACAAGKWTTRVAGETIRVVGCRRTAVLTTR